MNLPKWFEFLVIVATSLWLPALALAQNSMGLTRLGQIKSKEILESSGLALAAGQDALWTINDSGNRPCLYLVKFDGRLLATVKLEGATNVDWESLTHVTFGDRRYLIVGDVGDNNQRRPHCSLYVVPEPQVNEKTAKQPTTVAALRLNFVYEDGPRNCEAIAADKTANVIWLVEKIYLEAKPKRPPGIYQLPFSRALLDKPKAAVPAQLVAKRVGQFPIRNVTGMDISPDGQHLVIRNYWSAHYYALAKHAGWKARLAAGPPRPISLPLQPQGEAICFARDNQSVILTSEKRSQPIWKLDLNVQLSSQDDESKR